MTKYSSRYRWICYNYG